MAPSLVDRNQCEAMHRKGLSLFGIQVFGSGLKRCTNAPDVIVQVKTSKDNSKELVAICEPCLLAAAIQQGLDHRAVKETILHEF